MIEKVLQVIDERHRLLRRWLAIDDRQHVCARLVALADLQPGIPLGRLVKVNLPQCLVDGDPHQKLAKVVLLFQAEPACLEPAEKGAEDRLNDVLRIDAAGEPLADPSPG